MVNQKIIQRISRYRDALERYQQYGSPKILSWELAEILGLTAAQIRKDFSMVGISGKKKTGYLVGSLLENFNRILGNQTGMQVIVAGAKSLGQTILSEIFLSVPHIRIVAAFEEIKRETTLKVGKIRLPLFPVSCLPEFACQQAIRYGIIATVDPFQAQSFLDQMVLGGIRGVLSFSFVELKAPKRCVVRQVNLIHEFESMCFFAEKAHAIATSSVPS